jgi:hypothetical protein
MRPQMRGMSAAASGGGSGGRMALFGPVERTAEVMSNMVVQKLMRQVRARTLGANNERRRGASQLHAPNPRCDALRVLWSRRVQLRCEWLSLQCGGMRSSRTCCSK